MTAGRCSDDRGFTLLEMLVALVVFGFLIAALAQGVRVGLALRHAQTRQIDRTADLDAAMRILRTLLGQFALAPSGRVIASKSGKGVVGEQDRLSFVGELPTGLGATRRADITLDLENHSLVLSSIPHRHERSLSPAPVPMKTVLISGVEQLQLAYWVPGSAGRPSRWLTRWKSLDAPGLIRVRLAFAKTDPRRWPTLIVATRH